MWACFSFKRFLFSTLFFLALFFEGCGPAFINTHKRRHCTGTPTAYTAIGYGLESDPYLVCNLAQFLEISRTPAAWSKAYRLETHLDLSGYTAATYTPIGNAATPFSGAWDGNGKTISNLSYSSPTADYAGLFGYVKGSRAKIANLILYNFAVSGKNHVGTLAGAVYHGTVSFVRAVGGSVTTAASYGGGLIGSANVGVLVSTSSATGVTVGGSAPYHGGLIGYSFFSSILSSFATGTVSGTTGVGGLVGLADYGTTIGDSYSTGTVNGTGADVGGIAGRAVRMQAINSFTTSNVSSTGGTSANVGNVIGASPGVSSFSNTWYANTCVSGSPACMADPGGVGPAAGGASDFYNNAIAPTSSWNFSRTWVANAGAFPTPSPALFDRGSWSGCSAHSGDAPFAGGYGTPEAPFLVCTPAQLVALMGDSAYWSKLYSFRQEADIDLQGMSGVRPIGNGGTLRAMMFWDGDGHTVSNFSYSSVSSGGAGLFGSTGSSYGGAILRNLGVSNASVTNSSNSGTGALAGNVPFTAVLSTWASGATTGTTAIAYPIGGLVGDAPNGAIADSYSTVTVSNPVNMASASHGAFVGTGNALAGAFSNDFVTGSVTGNVTDDSVGLCAGSAAISCYYSTAATCTNLGGTTACQAIGTAAPLSSFYDRTQPPTSAWDFNRVWKSNPGGLPKLRTWGEY